MLQIDDAHHAHFVEELGPTLEFGKRHVLEEVDLGFHPFGAPLHRVGHHRGVQRRLEQIRAIGIVELADDTQQIVQPAFPVRIARKRFGAPHEGLLDGETRLEAAALLDLERGIVRDLEPHETVANLDELIAAEKMAVEPLVVAAVAQLALGRELLHRAERAGLASTMQHAIAQLPVVIAFGTIERERGAVKVHELVRTGIARVDSALAFLANECRYITIVHRALASVRLSPAVPDASRDASATRSRKRTHLHKHTNDGRVLQCAHQGK